MQYAICENGGMINEIIGWQRFTSKQDALRELKRLQELEDHLAEEFGEDDEPTTFDVVAILEDGTITTEC